jgi:D-amino peptidase
VNDIEGISGIDNVRQIRYGSKEFEEGRIQVTEDVNAAVRGLRAAGATEIRVADSHGSGGPNKNIISEKLERDVKLFQEGPVYKRLKERLTNLSMPRFSLDSTRWQTPKTGSSGTP